MDEVDRLILKVEGAKDVDALTKSLEAEAAAADKAKAATAGMSKAASSVTTPAKDLSGVATAATDALQGLATEGLGAVEASIPRLAEAAAAHIPKVAAMFGGPAGLAVAVASAVAAFVAMAPVVKNLFDEFASGGTKIPEANDALEKLKSRLDEGKKALKEMSENWHGTTAEVAKYNEQLAANVDLEARANAERERRRAVEEEAAGGKPVAGAAEAAQKAIAAGGGFDVVANEARNVISQNDPEIARLRAQIVDLNRKLTEGFKNIPGFSGEYFTGQIADAQKKIDSLTARNNTTAVDLVGRAGRGETAAIGRLAGLLPGGGFNAATPEGLASAKVSEEAAKQAVKDQQQWEKDQENQRKARAKAEADEAKAEAKAQAIYDKAQGDYETGLAKMQDETKRQAQKADRDAERAAARAAAKAPREEAKARDERETRQIKGIAASEFGSQLDDMSAKQALAEAREYVRLGAQPFEAALTAINNLLQTQAQAYQQYTRRFQQLGSQAAMMQQQQFQQGPAMSGFSGMPRQW